MRSPQDNQIDLDQIIKSNYRAVIIKYISYWKLFLLLIIIACTLSFLYLRYAVSLYEAKITIMIKDDQKGGTGMSETSAFEDFSIFNKGLFIENEKSILKSRRLMANVVKDLSLRNEYKRIGNYTGLRKAEVYKTNPFKVQFIYTDTSHFLKYNYSKIYRVNKNSINAEDSEGNQINKYKFDKVYQIDDKISFKIIKTDFFNESIHGISFRFTLLSNESCIDKYIGLLEIEQPSQNSTILSLKIVYSSSTKAVDILNSLAENYNLDAIQDKIKVSDNTEKFISKRIKVLAEDLGFIEDSLKKIKSSNDLIDYQYESQFRLGLSKEVKSKSLEASTHLLISQMMKDHIVNNNQVTDLIPVNLGTENQNIDIAIKEHNKLVIDRIESLKTSTEKNKKVINLEYRINELKTNILASINNVINTKQKILNEVTKEENELDKSIRSIPRFEKQLRVIKRQQEIKENLYVYLLQKREEALISRAVEVGNAKIVDPAYSNNAVVWPNKSLFYSFACLISIFLGVIYIYIRDLFRDKVYDKSDIDKKGLPYIGNIPLGEKNKNIVISKGSKTAISEAFRTLRTNIDFMKTQDNDVGRTIFITSSVAKEGKSFTAVNFSLSLALSGKKVLLLGMDLRAPKLEDYMGNDRSRGVTNYIVDSKTNYHDYIYTTELNNNIDVLPSGDIPPNPSELLMSEKVDSLFLELKKAYDYVIVDTAPVGIVSDTLLISKYADTVVYVVRAHQLPKKMLNIALDLKNDKRLPNMAILLNGTYGTKGYGYGYGY